MTRDRPTVFVVDDDLGVRSSVQLLMRSIGLEAETFSSALEFLAAYDPERPGCLVLDVRMPEMSGLELQERLVTMHSTLPIIFVTAHGDVPLAVDAIKAGAVDFVLKPFRDQVLIDKVQTAITENRRLRAASADSKEIAGRIASLTPREEEVMRLVVRGSANKEIARLLGISRRTVEVHRAQVMNKMRASSVSQLVKLVLRGGD